MRRQESIQSLVGCHCGCQGNNYCERCSHETCVAHQRKGNDLLCGRPADFRIFSNRVHIAHPASSFSASRISLALSAPSPAFFSARATAPEACCEENRQRCKGLGSRSNLDTLKSEPTSQMPETTGCYNCKIRTNQTEN